MNPAMLYGLVIGRQLFGDGGSSVEDAVIFIGSDEDGQDY